MTEMIGELTRNVEAVGIVVEARADDAPMTDELPKKVK